jgi:hypothetical protein
METVKMKNENDKMFAVIAICKEVNGDGGYVLTENDEEFCVCDCEWIEATCYCGTIEENSKDLKLFESKKEAEKFCKRWKGHPWYCQPKSFKIVELKPAYKQVLSHYEPIGE